MTVYSETISNKDILEAVENHQKLFITGCPVCANMSLTYKQPEKKPLMVKLSPKGLKAVSTEREVERLCEFLSEKGKDVYSWVGNFGDIMFCMLDEKAFEKFLQKCDGADAVVLVACESGLEKLQKKMADKRVVGVMKSHGLMMGDIGGVLKVVKVYLDKESVEIKRFNFTG